MLACSRSTLTANLRQRVVSFSSSSSSLSSLSFSRSLHQQHTKIWRSCVRNNSLSLSHSRCRSLYSHSHSRSLIPRRAFSSGSGNDRGSGELWFLLLRVAARSLGQIVSYLYRSGAWKSLSPSLSPSVSSSFSQTRRALSVSASIAASLVVLGATLFVTNAERVPYSQRLHITWLSHEEECSLSDQSREEILQKEKSKLLSEEEEIFQVTSHIVQDLLDVCEEDGIVTNKRRQMFKLYMIKSNVPNAFVLPDGTIFVYTGILPIAENEAGLAAVLGHEISHSLARHSSEKIGIMRMLILLFEFVRGLNDHTRDGRSMLIEFLALTVFQVGLPLAHSRAMEEEADRIGIKLAARAGYNPSQAAALWERMVKFEEAVPQIKGTDNGEIGESRSHSHSHTHALTTINKENSAANSLTVKKRLSELLSTHPCSERRIEDLTEESNHVMQEFHRKIDRLKLSGLPVPQSMRLLPYDGVRKRSISDLEYNFNWDNDDYESSMLAKKCSALMVGSQGDDIRKFLKEVGRLDVPWGGGH